MTVRFHILSRKEAREAVGDRAIRPVAIVSLGGAPHDAPSELLGCGAPLLALQMDDAPRDLPKIGYVAPTREQVEQLLTWWSATAPADGDVVLHCAEGISRSTACALALFAQDVPQMGGISRPGRMRDAARLAVLDLIAHCYASRRRGLRGYQEINPNVRIVWLADQILGWDGHLLAAVEDVFAMRGLWVDLGEEPPKGWPGRAA